jgi:hypothetical protein
MVVPTPSTPTLSRPPYGLRPDGGPWQGSFERATASLRLAEELVVRATDDEVRNFDPRRTVRFRKQQSSASD